MASEQKLENFADPTLTDVESTPEADGDLEGHDPPQAQKRKGGRKPIYATSEERKQRNRQAQAAFRERRTEYIKQLEITIKQHEESLLSLQQNHRTAADECLMLRYKNSLLERILLEKGIDVQAELQSKGEGFNMRPTIHTPITTGLSSTQRPGLQKYQQGRRNPPGLAPKLDALNRAQQQRQHSASTSSPSQAASPHFQGPTSPTDSPTVPALQNGIHSSSFANSRPQQYHQFQRPVSAASPLGNQSATSQSIGFEQHNSGHQISTPSTSHFASPAKVDSGFQSQFGLANRPGLTSIDSEHDAHSRTIDDQMQIQNHNPNYFLPQQQQQQQHFPQQVGSDGMPYAGTPKIDMSTYRPMSSRSDAPEGFYGGPNQIIDHSDPNLDVDPFGLSASMQFPTQF